MNRSGSVREREKHATKSGKVPPAIAHVAPSEVHVRRAASVRAEKARVLPTSPLAAGIVRQQSVATPQGSLVQRTIITHAPPDQAALDHSKGNKPRLTRQIAVSDEAAAHLAAKSVSFEPVHAHGVWESSVDDDDDSTDDAAHQKDRLAVPPVSGSRNRLGLAGFIPRKLSTISSRSCSVNPDADGPSDAQNDAETSSPLLGEAAGADDSRPSEKSTFGESPL